MKKILALLLFMVILLACSREDDQENIETEEPLITNIKFDMNRGGGIVNPNEINFGFEYDNQKRLVKKIGGYLPMSGSTGFTGFFSRDVYTSLIYSNNKVTVEDFSSSPDLIALKNSNYYTLNSSNQIIEREFSGINIYWYKKQFYRYENNKLVEVKTTLPNMIYDPDNPNDPVITYSEKFFYDSNGNLTKTEYYEQQDGINEGEKIIRTFENYDTSTNPTKRFYLLNEYFYRSLSKNNFRKYTETKYNYNVLTGSSELSWAFNYDSNGNIIVN